MLGCVYVRGQAIFLNPSMFGSMMKVELGRAMGNRESGLLTGCGKTRLNMLPTESL